MNILEAGLSNYMGTGIQRTGEKQHGIPKRNKLSIQVYEVAFMIFSRILLIEKDIYLADELRKRLWNTGIGADLKITDNAASALGFLSMETFDLVILDLSNSLPNGLELLRLLNDDLSFRGISILIYGPELPAQVLPVHPRLRNKEIEFLTQPVLSEKTAWRIQEILENKFAASSHGKEDR